MSDLEHLRHRVALGDTEAAWELVTQAGRHHDAESLEMAVRLLRARALSPEQAVGTATFGARDERELPELWSVSILILELNTWLLGWRRGAPIEVPLDDYLEIPPDVFNQAAESFRAAGWDVEYPVHRNIVFNATANPDRRREIQCPRCRIGLHLYIDNPMHGFGFDMEVEELRASMSSEGRQVAHVTCDRCHFRIEIDSGDGSPEILPAGQSKPAFLDAVDAAVRTFKRR